VKRPTNFKARSWRQLLRHYDQVQAVADRLSQRHRAPDALFEMTVQNLRASGLTLRQALVRMLRDARATRNEAQSTCPYCGGAYTLARSCTGPRTLTPGENTCARMAAHQRLAREASSEESPQRSRRRNE
jgi:hypothetical protein